MILRVRFILYVYLISILILALLTYPGGYLNPIHEDRSQLYDNTEYKREIYEFQLFTPKRGFIGYQPESTGVYSMGFRKIPTKDSDFDMHHIRIIEIKRKTLNERCHTYYRVDLFNKGGISEEDRNDMDCLYNTTLVVFKDGAFMVTRDKPFSDEIFHEGMENLGIPFPFRSTRPPYLAFKKGNIEGVIDCCGSGVRYELKSDAQMNEPVKVETIEFTKINVGLLHIPPFGIKYYGKEIDDIVKEDNIYFHCRQVQYWSKVTDAFWDKMERFNKNGNILMKCIRIK